jgi:hypothetical protein
VTTAKQATAASFKKYDYKNYEPNLALQMQPQYEWRALARVTFGWCGGSPTRYYKRFTRRTATLLRFEELHPDPLQSARTGEARDADEHE